MCFYFLAEADQYESSYRRTAHHVSERYITANPICLIFPLTAAWIFLNRCYGEIIHKAFTQLQNKIRHLARAITEPGDSWKKQAVVRGTTNPAPCYEW